MKRLLQLLGLRTQCCNAKIITWHHDRYYCAQCRNWLGEPKTAPVATSKTVRAKARIKPRLS